MDVRAILLIGGAQNQSAGSGAESETVVGVPLATVDVLGKPVVHRVAEQLLAQGVSRITVVADAGANTPATARQNLPAGAEFVLAEAGQLWRDGENAFEKTSDEGAELVIVWRLGSYVEFNVEPLVQAHLDQGARTTAVCDANGEALEIFVVCGSRRNDAAYLFRHQLQGTRMPGCTYRHFGYVNRLRTVADLRQLTADGLLLRNAVRPIGREIKPGVWLGEGARVQRGARLVAPCYVGARARVRAAVVLTRAAAIEHHAEVDCGTVVDGSNVLPFSYVGAGLDVCQSIVGYRKIAPLKRPVEVEVTDPKLVGMASEHAPVRVASKAGALFAFLPMQLIRGVLAKKRCEQEPDLASAINAPAAALREPLGQPPSAHNSAEFPANMVVARRYGNE
ncbi:MAG TPA: hypothetical protein VE998_09960 [Terriglobales bacterium]|nr:hypothetical protein [Terriglobales bacterium]